MPASRSRLRQARFLAVGLAVAAVVAGILFGFGSSPSPGGQVAPGIGPATANVLSLDVLPQRAWSVAPGFTLTDQHGAQVSLDQFRGKSVVLSFNDDQCPDLCTLLAQAIVVAHRDLGPAVRDVVFLSVNVNSFYPQVRYVKQWTDNHGLGAMATWHFTTGAVSTLEGIWHRYGIDVQPNPATKTVTHGSELFFVDPGGRTRAIGDFGLDAADTAYFAHGMAQLAVDLLPRAERVPVGGPQTPPGAPGNVSPGSPAPPFALPSTSPSGSTVRLSDFAGKPTVVDFWSATCVPCRAELAALEAAYRDLRGKVNVVGIDMSDNPATARAIAAQAHVTYPLAHDGSGAVASAYRITGTPTTFIVGRSGRIKVVHPGVFTTAQIAYELKSFYPSLAGGS